MFTKHSMILNPGKRKYVVLSKQDQSQEVNFTEIKVTSSNDEKLLVAGLIFVWVLLAVISWHSKNDIKFTLQKSLEWLTRELQKCFHDLPLSIMNAIVNVFLKYFKHFLKSLSTLMINALIISIKFSKQL